MRDGFLLDPQLAANAHGALGAVPGVFCAAHAQLHVDLAGPCVHDRRFRRSRRCDFGYDVPELVRAIVSAMGAIFVFAMTVALERNRILQYRLVEFASLLRDLMLLVVVLLAGLSAFWLVKALTA